MAISKMWESFMLKVYADSTLGYLGGAFVRPSKPLQTVLDCTLYEGIDLADSLRQEITEDDIF